MMTTSDSFDANTVSPHGDALAVEERRDTERSDKQYPARLIGWGNSAAVPCVICDVGEGGVYVHASASSALRVGGRYEVVVDPDGAGSELAGTLNEGCYATVVRTEAIMGQADDTVGAGLRFDRPLIL